MPIDDIDLAIDTTEDLEKSSTLSRHVTSCNPPPYCTCFADIPTE